MRRIEFYGISSANDQGKVLAGFTNKQNIYCTDPFLVKVNACSENERKQSIRCL